MNVFVLGCLIFCPTLALEASLVGTGPPQRAIEHASLASVPAHGTAYRGVAGSVDSRPAQAAPIGPTGGETYTAVQAARGRLVYERSCSECHDASLRGGANELDAPGLAGPFFLEKWSGRPLEELFLYAAENMPPGQPSLFDTAYLDITAYILQVLKYPSGNSELIADSPIMKRGLERQR
jgi:mono/diheme cytochrome c family protein